MIIYDKKTTGNIIKNARLKAKLSQSELAEKIGLNEKHISNIERGVNTPILDTFLKLCDVLELSLQDFGVHITADNNKLKEKLISDILSASDTELHAYNRMIQACRDVLQIKV